MGSSERSNLKEKITPFLAMTQADLEGMVKSKIVWGWIVAALFLEGNEKSRFRNHGGLIYNHRGAFGLHFYLEHDNHRHNRKRSLFRIG